MEIRDLYEYEDVRVSEFVPVPPWIEQDLTVDRIAAICEGGCESGAYMPAVTYYQARETMNEHGDDVVEFLADIVEDWRELLPKDGGWNRAATALMAAAVDSWADAVAEEVAEKLAARLAGE